MGVWSPSSSPDLPIVIHSSFNLFLISPWRLKENLCSCFSSINAFPFPSAKHSYKVRSPTKHPLGGKNERFKHPWEERKVNEKLTILISTLVCFVVKKGPATLLMTVRTLQDFQLLRSTGKRQTDSFRMVSSSASQGRNLTKNKRSTILSMSTEYK